VLLTLKRLDLLSIALYFEARVIMTGSVQLNAGVVADSNGIR
jgi:hypothetical protein